MENENEISIPDEQRQRLITVLESLEGQVKTQNSMRNAFLKGIVYGLGTVIGATILVALFGGILAEAINLLTEEPGLTESVKITTS